ncbi:MAG: trypsin-like peptidase domain-containing protein, partial [Candidatus Paceibacteria bacterium]
MENRSIRKTLLLAILLSVLAGFFSGGLGYNYFAQNAPNAQTNINTKNVSISSSQSAITSVVEEAKPAVVSIIVKQDLPKISDPFFGRRLKQEQQQIGGGTGFVVSSDGLIVTNKHVVNRDAEYTVLFNDGKKVEASVKAIHPATDLALLDVDRTGLEKLDLARSNKLKVGQTVIAIGNALGEFQNTVSKGIVSGLNRSITASGTFQEPQQLTNLVQTDAAINPGNSGGPLLDINGKVVGVNVAVAKQAQNIGFAIPSNTAIEMIEDFNKYGEIRVPFLGVRYITVNETIQETNNLSKDYGALLVP